MHKIFLAIGSNIYRRLALAHAYLEIKKIANIEQISAIYESEPRGKARGPNFYNTVLIATTNLELSTLKTKLKNIEQSLGRGHWIDAYGHQFELRCLDIDILLFDEVTSTEFKLPRVDIYKYDFVLRPLAEIAPDFVFFENKKSFAQMAIESNLPLNALQKVPYLGEDAVIYKA